MKTLLLFALFSLSFAGVFAQASADAKSISMMGVPLEGPDSVFMPALEAAGFVQVEPQEPEPDTYYLEGDFYGIKSSMIVTVNERTKMLRSKSEISYRTTSAGMG